MFARHSLRALALLLLTFLLSACAVYAKQTHFEVAIPPVTLPNLRPVA